MSRELYAQTDSSAPKDLRVASDIMTVHTRAICRRQGQAIEIEYLLLSVIDVEGSDLSARTCDEADEGCYSSKAMVVDDDWRGDCKVNPSKARAHFLRTIFCPYGR